MSEQSSSLPSGEYNAEDIEKTIALFPQELQQAVRESIMKSKEKRAQDVEAMNFKAYIAQFAIALHIYCVEDTPKHVNDINWSHLVRDMSELVIRHDAKGLPVEVPESVKKLAATFYAGYEFASGEEREDVDELLVPFGYPTEKILDDLVDEVMTEGRNNGQGRDEVKAKLSTYFERIRHWNRFDKYEPAMRQELIQLGYQLPELEADNSYGFSENEGETFPDVTEEMLPS